ncbi:MAG: hypothetical protein ABIN79_10305 [Marmoricola sp.]
MHPNILPDGTDNPAGASGLSGCRPVLVVAEPRGRLRRTSKR